MFSPRNLLTSEKNTCKFFQDLKKKRCGTISLFRNLRFFPLSLSTTAEFAEVLPFLVSSMK
jgi:hypothetical protein